MGYRYEKKQWGFSFDFHRPDSAAGEYYHRLWDGRCFARYDLKRIIDRHLVPNFKKQAYYDGLLATVQSISKHANGEYVNEQFGQQNNSMSDEEVFFVCLFIVLFIALFIYMMRKGRNSNDYSQYGTRRRHYSDDSGPTIFMGGGGGGWNSSSSSNDDDSGGFGGFGDGDTGGGGASGDW